MNFKACKCKSGIWGDACKAVFCIFAAKSVFYLTDDGHEQHPMSTEAAAGMAQEGGTRIYIYNKPHKLSVMTIETCDFKGKKVIVRVDFNVPLDENGKITDDTRIRGALPTLQKVLAEGGALIIMSHMGKHKGKVNPKMSLGQIVDAVSEKLGVKVKFAPDCAKAQEAAAALQPGEVLLLENLRFYPEEEGKPVGIDKADPAYDAAKKEMK